MLLRLFEDNIETIKMMAYSAMQKYNFIAPSEQDDYLQEILIATWNRLPQYDCFLGVKLTTFIYPHIDWAILKYHRKLQKGRHVLYIDNISSWYDVADEQYNEDYIDALNLAIDDLPAEKKAIVKSYLNGYTLRELDIHFNKKLGYHRGILHNIRKLILKHRGRYFDNISISGKKLVVKGNGRFNELNSRSTPIEMLDINGKFIKTFPSLMEAERAGFTATIISKVLKGKILSHKGFKWRLVGETRPQIIARVNERIRPVKQIDLNGNLVKIWNGTGEPSKCGFTRSGICLAAIGYTYSHRGYRWIYVDETNEAIINMPVPVKGKPSVCLRPKNE